MAQYNIFNIYDIMSSKVGDANNNYSMSHQIGTITTATGNTNQPGDVYQKDTQVWMIVGVSSMPANPTGNKDAAQSVSISMSDTDVIIGTRDTRFQSFVSDIQPGDVYIYATGPGAYAGIKIKAATNKILVTTSDMEVSNGGVVDLVAVSSKVNNEITNIWAALNALQTIFYAGGSAGLPVVTTGIYLPPALPSGPPYIPGSVAGSVLKADK